MEKRAMATVGIASQTRAARIQEAKHKEFHNNNQEEHILGAAQKDMWERVKRKLRVQLGEDVYTSWFNGLSIESVHDNTAHLSVPTRFLQQWIETHYSDRILSLLKEEQEDIEQIRIAMRGTIRHKNKQTSQRISKSYPALPQETSPAHDAQNVQDRLREIEGPNGGAPLDPRYRFSNFCEGQGNHMAFAAAKAIADGDRTVTFNPLFIHAKVGLGKTHLLQSIAWESLLNRNGRSILYFTSERFMLKMREGFAKKTMPELKARLRGVDVMIVDDIQFLAGGSFQQEFSHLLDALIESNKQVVVSADRPASELDTLDERVLSRLRGGVAFQLESPDIHLRKQIIMSRLDALKAADSSISISDVIIDYVAQAVKTNGRDLEGALNRLVAQQCYTKAPVTLESAKLVLRDLIRSDEPRKVLIEDIQRMVSNHFNIPKSDLISQRRTRAIVRPRQIAMYLCKTMTPRSLPEIGKRFGGRDHTTVIHAVQKVEQLMTEDRAISDDVELLKRLLVD